VNQGALLGVARNALLTAGRDTKAIDNLLAQQPGLAAWAQEVLDSDLHDLHVSGVIALWSSLEVAVEDTAVLVLMRDATAMSLVAGAGVKLPAPLSNPPTESEARRVFVRFDRLACASRSVSEAYCYILDMLGLSVSVPPITHRKLSELNYVRNCLLHRGGIVDDRVNAEAPGLGLSTGDAIRIGQSTYLEYFDAVGKFAVALLGGAVKSRHVRTK
jgi:hypothetical protein